MTKQKTTKRALLLSALSLLLCVSMLIGSTFAWFTDSVTTGSAVIQAGTLDIVLEYWNGTQWEDAEGKLYEVAEVDLTEYYDAAKNPAGGEELQPDLNTYGFTAVRANIMSGYAQIAFDGGALQDFQIELNNAGYNPETFALVPGTYTLGDGYDDFVISKGSSATFVEGAEPTAMTLTIVDAGDGKYQFGFTATVFGQNIEDRFTLPISAWS